MQKKKEGKSTFFCINVPFFQIGPLKYASFSSNKFHYLSQEESLLRSNLAQKDEHHGETSETFSVTAIIGLIGVDKYPNPILFALLLVPLQELCRKFFTFRGAAKVVFARDLIFDPHSRLTFFCIIPVDVLIFQ